MIDDIIRKYVLGFNENIDEDVILDMEYELCSNLFRNNGNEQFIFVSEDYFGNNSYPKIQKVFKHKTDNIYICVEVDADSWTDDGALGDYDVYQAYPKTKIVTVYERSSKEEDSW